MEKLNIIENLRNAELLEKMYRAEPSKFKSAFNEVYEQNEKTELLRYWHLRLNYRESSIFTIDKSQIIIVIILSIFAGILAKLPFIFNLNEELFYTRNIGFISFSIISIYFAVQNKLNLKNSILIALVNIIAITYINLLPPINNSDVINLATVHLVLFLWAVLGYTFISNDFKNSSKRISFLKYNGDLVVISVLILIAGGILSGITIGLFGLIGLNIEKFYFENVAIFGLAALPIVGTYLIQNNSNLVSKISPLIAKIFSPLVLIMLFIYLISIVYLGKDPYNDRDFLLIFNILLIGVMALIFFSVAESSNKEKSNYETWILFLLSLLSIIISLIALSAILFRINEWGLTPNRTAVLGTNLLILCHIIMVNLKLFRVLTKKADSIEIGNEIAKYLPVYFIWTIIVVFIFPLIFGV
jgi:hypothetical protein